MAEGIWRSPMEEYATRVIVGSFISLDGDVTQAPLRLVINNTVAGSGEFNALVWNDLHAAVTWLQACEHAQGDLARFDMVMTGSCTGMAPVRAGDRLRVSSDVLGDVDCVLCH